MIIAHVFGIPVEETALTFAPVILAVIAGARISGHQRLRKLRQSARHNARERHTWPPQRMLGRPIADFRRRAGL